MKKLLIGLIVFTLFFSNPAYSVNNWRKNSGENTPLGTENISDLDDVIFQRITDPLDRLLSHYRKNLRLIFTSATTVTLKADSIIGGEIACSKSDGTQTRLRQITSDLAVTFSDIDTGSEEASKTYYVYADCTATATTFVAKISLNATAPDSAITHFRRLGSFLNDSSSDVDSTSITNDEADYFGLSTYDSGWFSQADATEATKTHGLNTTNIIAYLYNANDSSGTNMQHVPGPASNANTDYAIVRAITTTQITISTGTNISRVTGAATVVDVTTGFFRIIAIALE